MADQKVDPNRPKNDPSAVATSSFPTATPPTGLPLGEPTLEAQRAAFKASESGVATSMQENPLAISGVSADEQVSQSAPELSGPAGTTKQSVQDQLGATKSGLQEQTDAVKAQQSAPPGSGTPAPASVPAPTAQPVGASSPAPVKSADPVKAAKDEGVAVKKGDPATQHATEAKGKTPTPVKGSKKK